jgi:hypothetical protein
MAAAAFSQDRNAFHPRFVIEGFMGLGSMLTLFRVHSLLNGEEIASQRALATTSLKYFRNENIMFYLSRIVVESM